MKYRRLQREELEAVRDEFVQFLAANSVTADDWQKLITGDSEKANGLIDVFSDIFWEKALSRVKYLVDRGGLVLRAYRADDDQLQLIQVTVHESAGFRFDRDEDWRLLTGGQRSLTALQAEVVTGSKATGEDRNKVLFELLETGATPDKSRLYDSLKLHLQQTL